MTRLPAHIEVAGLIRRVQAAGGFAAVLHAGDKDAGAILVVSVLNGQNQRLFERMPSLEQERLWSLTKLGSAEDTPAFDTYLRRRTERDPDTWVIELDIANPERFIGLSPADD